MECPTCFQKITVPQAPATDDPKFIITGTKVGERPAPTIPEDRVVTAPESNSPMVVTVAVLLVLACAAAAAVYVFRGQIFKSGAAVPTNQVNQAGSGSNEAPTPTATTQPRPRPAPPPPLVAPPANDTNWTLNLEGAAVPDSLAAGRIHGQDFICERAYIENGTLMLRVGTRGQINLGLAVNFGGAQPESLAGQTVNVATNAEKAAVVTMRYLGEDQKLVRESYTNGYALRLNFNQLIGNRLSGKIYFCAPDATKSYVLGTFNAEIRRPRPRPPS